MDKIEQQINIVLEMMKNEKSRKMVLNFLTNDTKIFSQNLIKLKKSIESKGFVSEGMIKKYFMYANTILQKGEKLEEAVGQKYLIQKIKKIFRMLMIDSPVYESLLVKRAYDKPRGYPGDYQMIELFYNNKTISTGIGFCGDKYILKDSYVVAVRKRKDCMREILSEYFGASGTSLINVMNIGSGSCREIRELFKSSHGIKKKIIFTLIDQDKGALDFSRDAFKRMPGYVQENVKFNFVKENVLNIFRKHKYKDMLQGQDMIYSIGLADYLPDLYLGRLLKFCFESLKQGGKIIIAHKNIKKYNAVAPDWFCDWSFFPRSKENLVDILTTYIDTASCKIEFKEEKLKYIYFVVVSKL